MTQIPGSGKRVALVHDALDTFGGGERVLHQLHRLYPEAPIFTSVFSPASLPPEFRGLDVRTSFLQSLPKFGRRGYRPYLPLYPLAFESFDFSNFDLVISNSGAWGKAVITQPGTTHIDYCLTPMRWAWRTDDYLRGEGLAGASELALRVFIGYLRAWDVAASLRVDHFVAISGTISARIRRYYSRDSTVIFPPIEERWYQPLQESEDFYLLVSRLVPYKRIDVAIRAFQMLNRSLVVVGAGRAGKILTDRAPSNVHFLGAVSDATLADLYRRCKAVVCPAVDDFGLVQVEAQAAGKPVVALAEGGSLETVVDGTTGVFFTEQTPDSLTDAVCRLDSIRLDRVAIQAHARKFDAASFARAFTTFVDTLESARPDSAGSGHTSSPLPIDQ
jgi:glycosyltransferase involved in cell wall biosynthesis